MSEKLMIAIGHLIRKKKTEFMEIVASIIKTEIVSKGLFGENFII